MSRRISFSIAGSVQNFPLENRIFNVATLIALLGTLASLIANILSGLPIHDNAILIFYCIACAGLFYYSRFKRKYRFLPLIFLLITLPLLSVLWFLVGGSRGSLSYAFLIFYFLFLVTINNIKAAWIIAIVVANVLGLFIIEYLKPEWVVPYSDENTRFFDISSSFLFVLVGLGIGITALKLNYDRERKKVDHERHKSDQLLLNILPEEISQVLKSGQRVIADSFDNVSVLFADIVNFTPMSAPLTPAEVVEMLNEIFSHFDTLAEKHEIEKIKTIGDCYMAAAGVPRPNADHARVLTQVSLDMMDYTKGRKFHGREIALRIGINSGTVTAGVIGRKKFIYDLWGDVVNTASRMESHGSANEIQITSATYELIKEHFQCESYGTIYVKGKGEMEVWRVLGIQSSIK
jgi:guanylate cyclase